MTSLDRVFDLRNLRRSYRWLLSNTDATYKSYFRDSYDAFATASDTLLKRIRIDGLSHRYTPSHASKIMIPKASGTLRPITLLTVEDQVVYQAIVNVIADILKPRTKHRYRKRVFAHLYGGKSSPFFYMRWQDSYRMMARSIAEVHAKGFVYVANFDLAAFYDSIDHHVLCHFLREIGIDEEVIQLLMTCLEKWTSSTWSEGPAAIYHRHGIPQGPLSSGMLSEVVLQHIDHAGERGARTRYMRYVDDIKIFAKSEGELRRKLIALDLTTKEIGLFPQTSKINIRKIKDPAEEIKTVSRPDQNDQWTVLDQSLLIKRLLQLSRRGKINQATTSRFRYLLSQAGPNHRLSARLLEVLRHHPEMAGPVARYLTTYKAIPRQLAAKLLALFNEPELYQSVNADLLRAILGRLRAADSMQVGLFCAGRLLRPQKGLLRLQPSYREALIAWVLRTNQITFAELASLLSRETDWWVRKCILRELTSDLFGLGSYRDFLNTSMRFDECEIATCSAARVAQEGVALIKPYGDVHESAKGILKAAKVIRSTGAPRSLINPIIAYVIRRPETPYDWIGFFGPEHRHAEQMALFLKQRRETDIDAFLTQFDSFADAITEELFKRFCPGKKYPNYGGAFKHPTLVSNLPVTMDAFLTLHNLRLSSFTAHPRSLKSGSGTRRLKHADYRKIAPVLAAAFDELETGVAP